MAKKVSSYHTAKVLLGILVCLLFCAGVRADTIDKLSDLEGFYVLKVKTIDGWMDKDKKQKKSGFEGCDWDRSSFLKMARLQHVAPTATATPTGQRRRFSSNP